MVNGFGLGRFWDGYYHYTFRVMGWTATLSAAVFTLMALVLWLQNPYTPLGETLLAGMMLLVLGWAIVPFAYILIIYPSALLTAALLAIMRRLMPVKAALLVAAALTAAVSVVVVMLALEWIIPFMRLAASLVLLVVPVTAAASAAWLAPRHYAFEIARESEVRSAP